MDEREQQLLAMKKALFFFENKAIHEVYKDMFKGDPVMLEHVDFKLKVGEYTSMRTMFFQLDTENRRRFLEYVLDNYKGVTTL